MENMENITRDFVGAYENEIEVWYNAQKEQFEVYIGDNMINFPHEDGANTYSEVQNFILSLL